tara:strand:+ start:6114 stop:7433 length:1320 start_codon:yes stop_codon:yes gene_type:complete
MSASTSDLRVLKIGICGYGTVGRGTHDLLVKNEGILARRLDCIHLTVTHVASRSLSETVFGVGKWSTDPIEVVNDPEVDIVVEAIGGLDTAFEVVKKALSAKKNVVTANKALIATHGNELVNLASENGVRLLFESAVAGGIPILKCLREGLAANNINWLAGIINGTGNYILTEMGNRQRLFSEVLHEAQALGYAEADPSFDVEGTDAAHKLAIMASIAFGMPLAFDKTYIEGISSLELDDIKYANELGYCIKHLGIARLSDQRVQMRVHPSLISSDELLASVDGVGNAVVVNADPIGSTLYSGPGAGAEATASAVVADLIDLARSPRSTSQAHIVPSLGFSRLVTDFEILDIDKIESEYYLRINVEDHVGVMANITGLMEKFEISIDAVIQKEKSKNCVQIVILTQMCVEQVLNSVIAEIENLKSVSSSVVRIRVASFE